MTDHDRASPHPGARPSAPGAQEPPPRPERDLRPGTTGAIAYLDDVEHNDEAD